tara:strand:+ start:1451 stop:2827 length:1377 start_codon:yes stop_codon:yes gene_type:complete
MLIVLGNPGSANDLIAKALSLSPTVHHFKGAKCDLLKTVSGSAKLFMDDIPTDGTVSVQQAMGMLKQKQNNFYCGAGFKLEPEWTNNLFIKTDSGYKAMHSIRKLVAGNFGVNTYRNHKHTDVWPDHYGFWKASIDGINLILEDSYDHEGNNTDFGKQYVLAEYGNFHWFKEAFPTAELIFPMWRNQMHFAHYYHLRQYGHAKETDTLNNKDTNSHGIGFGDELVKRFIKVTDTKHNEAELKQILFKYPHYIPQHLMIHHQINVDEFLDSAENLESMIRTALRRSMFFAMRKENMMRVYKADHTKIIIDDFFTDETYRQKIYKQFDLEYPDLTKFLQSIHSVMIHNKPRRGDLPQEWKDMHNPSIQNKSLLDNVLQIFHDYCNGELAMSPTTALDDIKVFAPGKKQQWTTADELVIELTLVLNGVFDNIEQTNIGPWTDIYTIAEFVHRLEKHVEAMD